MFIRKIKWLIQLPFIGSVLSIKSCMVTKLSPCNLLVLLGFSVLTNTIHLVEIHGEFRIQLAYRQPFFTSADRTRLSMVINGLTTHANQICSLCLSAIKDGELKLLHFFKNDHDKSSHQLSLRFQRHRRSPELDECQMGRRRRCCGRFGFGKCAVSSVRHGLSNPQPGPARPRPMGSRPSLDPARSNQ